MFHFWCLWVLILLSASVSALPTYSTELANRSSPEIPSHWTGYLLCPPDTLVNGISLIFKSLSEQSPPQRLKRGHSQSTRDTPIPVYGLNISCSSIHPSQPDEIFEIVPLLDNNTSSGGFREHQISKCDELIDHPDDTPKLHGMAVGMEKRFSEASPGSKALMELEFYCNYEEEVRLKKDSSKNLAVAGHRWAKPDFCSWGQYICGFNIRYNPTTYAILDVNKACCELLESGFGWTNYRGETHGSIIQSLPLISPEELHTSMRSRSQSHYLKELDDPYYYKWEFCPQTTYVTGLQAQLNQRQFRLSCSDISQPKPRATTYLSMPTQGEIWEWEDHLTQHLECEGVVIGFQILYEENSKQIQGLRFFCSFSSEEKQLPYIKALLPPINDTKSIYSWGQEQMCRRHQALCGFKAKLIEARNGSLLGVQHLKAKCCTVPPTAEICAPSDGYELIVECDAREAMADTTCQYTQSEGLTSSQTTETTYRRGEDMRRSLSREWTLSESDTNRETEETGETQTDTESRGNNKARTVSSGGTTSVTDSDSASQTNTTGLQKTRGGSTQRNRNWGLNRNQGSDKTVGNSGSSTFSNTHGSSSSSSFSNMHGQSDNYLNTRSLGYSFSDSSADTVGSSMGTVAAKTLGSSNSRSTGHTSSDSSSSSNTDSRSSSTGTSSSDTDSSSSSLGGSAGFSGFGFTASIQANMEKGHSNTKGTNSEQSKSSSLTETRDRSNSQNTQDASDTSLSHMNQVTSDHSNSRTRTTGRDTNHQHSFVQGGDRSSQFTNGGSRDINDQSTIGGERGHHSSGTLRNNLDKTFNQGEVVTGEESETGNNQRGNEVSRSRQLVRSREDSATLSDTYTKDKSRTSSHQRSRSGTKERMVTKGGSGSGSKDNTFSTGYDWSHTSGHTWTKEKKHEVTMTVPPGYRTKLYQVVGYCAHFQVRTNNFRRVDDVAEWVKEEEERERNNTAKLF